MPLGSWIRAIAGWPRSGLACSRRAAAAAKNTPEGGPQLTDDLLDALSREARALAKEVSQIDRQLQRLERTIERVLLIARADQDAAASLDRVAAVMGPDVGEHAREAIAAGVRRDDPFPHLIVANLLPGATYRALVDAIPPPVFFDCRREGDCELRIPPALAPIEVAAVWTFWADLVKYTLAPALVTRFADLLPDGPEALRPVTGRIVRRRAGDPHTAAAARGYWLRLVLRLIPPGEDAGASVLAASDPVAGRVTVPVRANQAIVLADRLGTHAYAAPVGEAPELYACEFVFGRRRNAASGGV